ncbi:rRNA methyltransferase 1, mitochondrial-like isoform X2 [Acipenser ruthenus]|uniref:rRNA methyltransferase 1, mitochondrial-like isoform X2 n=1 Tax=Acipenser ruthenus TaxID=7906 RepID=UPI002741EA39|nr:rRNA methyltransferase 1, mitochondrial-like isoform X2 [Acipenser ruthenus]
MTSLRRLQSAFGFSRWFWRKPSGFTRAGGTSLDNCISYTHSRKSFCTHENDDSKPRTAGMRGADTAAKNRLGPASDEDDLKTNTRDFSYAAKAIRHPSVLAKSYSVQKQQTFIKNKKWSTKIPKPELRNRATVANELQRLRDEDTPSPKRTGSPSGIAYSNMKNKDSEIVFGVSPCYLALAHGRRALHGLYVKESRVQQRPEVREIYRLAESLGVTVQQASRRALDGLCGGRVHQGMCLEASPLGYVADNERIAQCTPGQSLWLVLEGIQDPMNMGALLRTAYFLGVDRVVASLHNSCPLSPVVSKASAGAMEALPVYGSDDLPDLLKTQIAGGWQVIGTVGTATKAVHVPVLPCSEFHWSQPTILALGSEGSGLSAEVLALCGCLLTIPPGGEPTLGMDSLNVSVAADEESSTVLDPMQ